VALSAVAALALGGAVGCGSEVDAEVARVDIRIAIAMPAGEPARSWRLRCEPSGGDWPRRAGACGRLDASLLAPIGPESRDLVPIAARPVRLTGSAFGAPVSLYFPTAGSSTRRERFRALTRALGRGPFAHGGRRSP
jgi:hypothetical protein